MNLFSYRLQIREAVWLWLLLNLHGEESDAPWRAVSAGNGITDEECAFYLGVPAPTAQRWRVRLERAGLIRCTLVAPRHWRIELLNLKEPKEPESKGLVN